MLHSQIEQAGIIAIVRTDLPIDLLKIGSALARGGIQAMEITLNTPGALGAIPRLRETLGPVMHVGAGTILDPQDAEDAIHAGAEFIVTPTLQMGTISLCRAQAIPIVCGCMTPTEALAAHRAGADFIKVFPAEVLGVTYIKAILAPLPFLKLIPTGGVSLDNLGAFIEAGCVGVALGGNLVSRRILLEEDWEGLSTLAKRYVQALSAARRKETLS